MIRFRCAQLLVLSGILMLMCFGNGKVLVIFSRYEHFVRFGQAGFRNIRNFHVKVRLLGADLRC